MDMKRLDSSLDIGVSGSRRNVERQPHGRDAEEKERRRREWMRQQEREREHEKLKRKKIEEYERKRRAQEQNEPNSHGGRSSYRSNSGSKSESPNGRRREETRRSASKPSVMSQKFESSSNNTRLFKGPEGTKIDVTELRRIKVDIHRNITTGEMSNELQRDILDPEDVKVKRRKGEGCKPIFEREELKKPEIPVSDVEEHRTVVALDDFRTERRQHTTKKRTASPTSPVKRPTSRRNIDIRDSSLARQRILERMGSDIEVEDLRHEDESSKRNSERLTSHRSHRHESDRDRGRSKEDRTRHRSEDNRERRSPRRTSHHSVARDHRNRRNRSHSADRESRRSDTRNRSSRDILPHRDNDERLRDDSRDRRSRDNRSRERSIHMSHYAEAMQVPLYYETFHPRPIMIGPMMAIRGQMPMGRGRMPPMMGPMRPPYPPRFLPPEMFRPTLHPNPRFARMF